MKRNSLRDYIALAAVIAFIGGLAFEAGRRMSDDLLLMALGIVCGIGLSIPVSLLILFVIRRPQPERVWEIVDADPKPYPTYYYELPTHCPDEKT